MYSSGDESDKPAAANAQLTVNKRYAADYERRKRLELLHRARDMGLLSDDSDSESEDEGEALTPWKDMQIMKLVQMIRDKDPRVYEGAAPFFDSSDSEPDGAAGSGAAPAAPRAKPLTLRKVLAHQTLAGVQEGEESDSGEEEAAGAGPGSNRRERAQQMAYNDEQRAIKDEFARALAAAGLKPGDAATAGATRGGGSDRGGSDSDDDDLFTLRKSGRSKKRADAAPDANGDAPAAAAGGSGVHADFLSVSPDKLQRLDERERAAVVRYMAGGGRADQAEQFLHDYVLSRRWEDEDNDALPTCVWSHATGHTRS